MFTPLFYTLKKRLLVFGQNWTLGIKIDSSDLDYIAYDQMKRLLSELRGEAEESTNHKTPK